VKTSEKRKVEESQSRLVELLKKLARKHTIQYALLLYIAARRPDFNELFRVYKEICDKGVKRQTVYKQLKKLEEKRFIKKKGGRYVAIVDPTAREIAESFNKSHSRVGKLGATIRHMGLKVKSTKISPGFVHYLKVIVEKARKLIREGKREVALNLLIHTLLPLRKSDVLWLWHGNTFVYYSRKVRSFRSVRSEKVAQVLRELGFREGIMIHHVKGLEESGKIIKRIFSRGSYSWTWARSIAYQLKKLGFLEDGWNYRIQLRREGDEIELMLWNLYTKELVCHYSIRFEEEETPEPLKNKPYHVAVVIGRAHIRKEVEENSYSSKWYM